MEYQRGVIRSNLIDNGQRVGMDKWLLRFDAQPSVLYVKESNHQQFSIREGNPWHLSHLICHQFHLNTITVATLELNPRGGGGDPSWTREEQQTWSRPRKWDNPPTPPHPIRFPPTPEIGAGSSVKLSRQRPLSASDRGEKLSLGRKNERLMLDEANLDSFRGRNCFCICIDGVIRHLNFHVCVHVCSKSSRRWWDDKRKDIVPPTHSWIIAKAIASARRPFSLRATSVFQMSATRHTRTHAHTQTNKQTNKQSNDHQIHPEIFSNYHQLEYFYLLY